MSRRTATGRPGAVGSPRVTRRRSSLADTSSAGIGTRSTRPASPGTTLSVLAVGSAPGRRREAEAHALHQPQRLVPMRKVGERVLAEQEPPLRAGLRSRQFLERVEGVRRALTLDLDGADLGPRQPLGGCTHELQACPRRRHGAAGLAPGIASRHEHDAVELQRAPRRGGEHEVREVRRVERPAQHTNARSVAHSHVSSTSPMRTRSPDRTPSRVNARCTPSRRSRSSNS